MKYRFLIISFLSLFVLSCENSFKNQSNKFDLKDFEKYTNTGFALIYNDDMPDIGMLESRSLNIYHKSLKKKSMVKITNPINGKYLIAKVVSNKIKFSNFYNSVLTSRVAEELALDPEEPYIELTLISQNSTYVAKKAKMFEEEKSVAEKAPVDGIQINDLNNKKKLLKSKKLKSKRFSYSIKIADFYFEDTAKIMLSRIRSETSIKNLRIVKLSETKYRVLIGPFNDIKTLKNSFEKLSYFNFENLEILKNA